MLVWSNKESTELKFHVSGRLGLIEFVICGGTVTFQLLSDIYIFWQIFFTEVCGSSMWERKCPSPLLYLDILRSLSCQPSSKMTGKCRSEPMWQHSGKPTFSLLTPAITMNSHIIFSNFCWMSFFFSYFNSSYRFYCYFAQCAVSCNTIISQFGINKVSIHLSIYLSICLSIYLSICLSIYLSIYPIP